MLKISLLLLLVGLAAGGPPLTRTREQIESFRNFLEKSRTENGVRLSERMLANPKASAWENSGKFEGDILLDDWQVEALVEQFSGARNAYIWPGTKWPQNTIVYEFGEGEFDEEQKEAIMVSIRDIEKNTCLKFRERRSGEFNYVKLTGRPDGCYANVGYWYSRGLHIMNLARNKPGQGCFIHTTIVHEWLHIIGFFHMQSTYNRDDYVRIMWDNVWEGMEHNFDRYDTNIVHNMGLPYEYTSCMHYGPYGFSINGEPTIVPIRSFEGVMGQQEYVTEYDWLRVRRHYNCPGGWSKDTEINSELEEQKVNFVEEAQEELQQQAQQQQALSQSKARMPRARAYNKPRGRMTAYAFFVQTCREEHKKKHPEENVIFAAFSKKCAERWNTMSKKEKQRFHDMADQDKQRYDLEMQNYVPPKDVKVRGRKRHQVKDPNAPKRSLSAFFWFCNDERSKVKANNPEYTMGDIAKELGRRWAAADPDIKAKYDALSEQDKARYDREMTAYKKTLEQQQSHPEVHEDVEEYEAEEEFKC